MSTRIGKTRTLRAAGAFLAVLISWVVASFPVAAIEIPVASCRAAGFNCNDAPPTYGGPTPTNWEAATQLACVRFAAAHRTPERTCACDGRVCSVPLTCTLQSIE